MELKDRLTELGITQEGTSSTDGSVYTISLADSNAFAKMYSKLDHIESLSLLSNATVSSENGAVIIYEDDEYRYTLRGNFTIDSYKLIIERI